MGCAKQALWRGYSAAGLRRRCDLAVISSRSSISSARRICSLGRATSFMAAANTRSVSRSMSPTLLSWAERIGKAPMGQTSCPGETALLFAVRELLLDEVSFRKRDGLRLLEIGEHPACLQA